MCLTAPQHAGKLYVCLWSKTDAVFEWDAWTDVGLSFLNTPLMPAWFGAVPQAGKAYPAINAPAGALLGPVTLATHVVFLDGLSFDGFADNAVRMEVR